MANRRPDYLMLAAMETFGVIPRPVAEMLVRCYDAPAPVSYEAAVEFVKSEMFELIASGALEDVAAMQEPPLPVMHDNAPMDDDEHEHICEDCEFERRYPPTWMLDCFQFWGMINSDD
jgi:hypothetical protein